MTVHLSKSGPAACTSPHRPTSNLDWSSGTEQLRPLQNVGSTKLVGLAGLVEPTSEVGGEMGRPAEQVGFTSVARCGAELPTTGQIPNFAHPMRMILRAPAIEGLKPDVIQSCGVHASDLHRSHRLLAGGTPLLVMLGHTVVSCFISLIAGSPPALCGMNPPNDDTAVVANRRSSRHVIGTWLILGGSPCTRGVMPQPCCTSTSRRVGPAPVPKARPVKLNDGTAPPEDRALCGWPV
eukprot:CAMPEP_0177152990 /NCGR_PEP_ID=MMETSP0367-20130122/835_1 /TAXON_ID=447022 ORGANISM="Scrippsiella hangoei-like, Strain SHHI-4" /NCGR_SAMPLE_ID=MMETSP0367 /ASSEMBLY_ACC=CAM_ASM_000362 /LENGTH=236 /DNA_ID=CAMNT_0018598109 /DNA_START=3 /DNA_END=711 /DNA_ORIENTATION=-